MKGYLLDTHALIWWLIDDASLNLEARAIIEDPGNEIFASTASLWEIGIKFSTGKMMVHPSVIAKGVAESGLILLNVKAPHAIAVADLPFFADHRDPFDRLLVTQAQTEDLVLITNDPKIIANYDVQTLCCETAPVSKPTF
ncbi:PIN domain nuclease [Paramagnetospirillum kuznetsovii]|uniref:PIN domain nuclease n=1 Tax=Paramagnetospirillum kuznetsovii TaxID=2053833 RepID=A0A364P0Z5_9PROT|nr:type II toxin-antitoxin system VapC family toxin [Paramagnetospirillum kuznetsovii]RAU23019.1 PIN domain nuclease [Paramagnetospirillum kuznetsovii]